jgi:L-2-amino-thiazoline-4-carboxylic acid hydrolase
LLPRIPYIGGKENMFTPVMVINGWIIALYRAMKSRGRTVEEVVRISYEASDDFFRSFPPFIDKLIGKLATTGYVVNHIRQQAERSQERRYPEDFVYTCRFSRRDEELELEFTECPVQKYYEAEGVEELKPYCNFFDPIYSKYFVLGVRAEETLGLGCRTCKLNYNTHRETVLPSNIRHVVDGRASHGETEGE